MAEPREAVDLIKQAAQRQKTQREIARQDAIDTAARLESERDTAARTEPTQP